MHLHMQIYIYICVFLPPYEEKKNYMISDDEAPSTKNSDQLITFKLLLFSPSIP